MERISVLLVDDHAVLRNGLRSLLEREPGYHVVGEAADGPTAIELVERLAPRVLILDLMLQGMSGLEVIRQLRKRAPETRVVVLSMHADTQYVREAFQAGALGYFLKEGEAAEVLQGIREAAHGRRCISRILSTRLAESNHKHADARVDDPYELLTDSERAVLKLAAQGQTSTEIAGKLALSQRTVETYRANILHKLDLKNTAELVRYAIKRGIITLE